MRKASTVVLPNKSCDRYRPDTGLVRAGFLFGRIWAHSIQRQAPTIQASFPKLRLLAACCSCPGFIGLPSIATEQPAFEPQLIVHCESGCFAPCQTGGSMKRLMTAGPCLMIFSLALASPAFSQSSQTFYVKAKMSPNNEVPAPVGLNATGSVRARVTVNRDAGGTITSGVVTFDLAYQFPGAVTLIGFHIHRGAVDVSGTVVISSGLSSTLDFDGVGSLTRTTPTLTTAAQLAALTGLVATPHLYYINLHTPELPDGAIRGQCTSESFFYKATMLPSNEVPAITGLNASAPVLVTLDVTRDSSGNITSGVVMFDTNYQFPGNVTLIGFDIHTGRAGENGPVIISSGVSSIVDTTGVGKIARIVSLPTTQAMLDNLKAVITNPNGHYVNLQTSVNPEGAVRAQLSDANQFSCIPSVLEDSIFRSNLGIQNLTNMASTVVVNVAGETGAGLALTA
ncbi:MAG: CHRD domain-containing protein [Acidobacteria bacterium]|nr:CHRD domain-containing protein [Acidobacteriota bacterium]